MQEAAGSNCLLGQRNMPFGARLGFSSSASAESCKPVLAWQCASEVLATPIAYLKS
jgi:hypothetical protein